MKCIGYQLAQLEELGAALPKKQSKEEEELEIKWPYWDDLNFLRASLAQNTDEDTLAWTAGDTDTFILFYQTNESLWNHNIPEYHTNRNKDLLFNCLIKELKYRYTKQDVEIKWKSLLKFYRQEHEKAQHKPSGWGTDEVYQSSWEFYTQLQFANSVCDDTDDTIDTITGPSTAKKRKKERDDIEVNKLELFKEAVVTIQAPLPPTIGRYVGVTLSKLSPSIFRRAKRCISDMLFDFEEKDEMEKANNASFARNSTTRGFSRVDYSSSLASGFNYSDTSCASASNSTSSGFNLYHLGHMQPAEQTRPSFGVDSSHRNQPPLQDLMTSP
ncbi:uncharacterized protein LOC125563018 [Nematostella vectensis]|uniref:uncharacterized protein LOC125563018 n=1 Tax=Nematostella vectensis TaxID=45351 RepID=UPI0020772641|nr:uncharacterized protein LOC125563018 [Nematostella vectensis]